MNLKACVKRNEAKIRKVVKEKEKIKRYIEDTFIKSKIEYRYIAFNLENKVNNENSLQQVKIYYPFVRLDDYIVNNEIFKRDATNNIVHSYSLQFKYEEVMKVEETASVCNCIRGKNGIISMKNKPVYVTKIHYVVWISSSKFEFDKIFELSEVVNELDLTKKIKVYKDNALYNKQSEKYLKFLNYNFNMPNPVDSLKDYLSMNGQRIQVNNNIDLEVTVSKSDATLPVFCESDELLAKFDNVKAIKNKVIICIIKIRTGETFKEEFEWVTIDENVKLKSGITIKELIELLDIE